MMPDLGKYALPVLGAYGVAIVLILALTWLSLRRSSRLRKELSELERRRKKNG